MFKKIINFIKYHNAFVIIVMFIFAASFSALAANENLRDKVLGEKIVTESGIDNSVILAADLENFDLEMKILDVREDEDNYYLDYQFRTLGIQENVWQTILRQKELKISKKVLAEQDLGLYVAEELGEMIDYELAYLKEIQENENKKGNDRIVQETKYEGLLGLVISTKTKELSPEYELVVKPSVVEEITPIPSNQGRDDQSLGEIDIPDDSSYYQKLKELCEENDLFWYDNICNDEPETVLACDIDNINLCNTRELCEEVNSYWYNDICNIEPETAFIPPDQGGDDSDNVLVCDADNLILCDTKDLCDEMSLYWYDDICNDKEEAIISEPVCDSDNLNLCGENNCEIKGGFWYGDVCNIKEEVVAEPEPVPEPEINAE